MIDEPDGFLPIVTFDGKTKWKDLHEVVKSHLDLPGMSRLEKAFSASVQSVVVERHYIDRDYRDTFSKFHSRRFSTPDSRCIRLHFFDVGVTRDAVREAAAIQSHYLGYSVLRPTKPNSIGRTLVRPEIRSLSKVHICVCKETISIQGSEFAVHGFPFISQDGDVTVCAQAALWMVARYFSDKYSAYPEIYPVQISGLVGDYSLGRAAPSSGLYVSQLCEPLRRLGFSPLTYYRAEFDDDEKIRNRGHASYFAHLLYTYIESGIPVLAAFKEHVVALFGHMSDYSRLSHYVPPSPDCDFFFSSDLNTTYIGNDDNGMPYQKLEKWPSDDGEDPYKQMKYAIHEIQQFIVPLPEKVFLPAESFEVLVRAILLRDDLGYKSRSPWINKEKPILRLFLTTGRAFKSRLNERGMGNPVVVELYHNSPLPHFIWVCEISHLTMYPKKVLGEVIWDATRNAHETDGWIALHYPEMLMLDTGSAQNMPPNLVSFPLENSVNYPIYSNNLRDI